MIIFLVFLIDQVSKFLVIRYLAPIREIKILSFFSLTYQENTGVAFSLLSGKNSFFIFLSSLIIIFLLFLFLKERRYNFPFALVLGGALGNLFDRVVRGKVIDFLNFRIWPVFNFADAAITIGIFLIFWQAISRKRKMSAKTQNISKI